MSGGNRWLGQPPVRLVRETDEHWRHLERLLSETGTGGNLTSDAYLAALAISRGATLVSFDNRLRLAGPGKKSACWG